MNSVIIGQYSYRLFFGLFETAILDKADSQAMDLDHASDIDRLHSYRLTELDSQERLNDAIEDYAIRIQAIEDES